MDFNLFFTQLIENYIKKAIPNSIGPLHCPEFDIAFFVPYNYYLNFIPSLNALPTLAPIVKYAFLQSTMTL